MQSGELDDDSLEPPLPANLQKLTAALSDFADFLRIDSGLLAVAAEASPSQDAQTPDHTAIAAWVASLSTAEKDELLARMIEGNGPRIGTELRARFDRQTAAASTTEKGRRTAAELLAAAQTRAEKRLAEQNRKTAMEKAERERLASLAREKHLHSVASRVPELWSQLEALITTKQPKSYDLAMQHLLDLRDVARREGNEAAFAERVASLREKHYRKPSFLTRLTEKGM